MLVHWYSSQQDKYPILSGWDDSCPRQHGKKELKGGLKKWD